MKLYEALLKYYDTKTLEIVHFKQEGYMSLLNDIRDHMNIMIENGEILCDKKLTSSCTKMAIVVALSF